MKQVNVGLIGLGGMGKIHMNNCLRLPTARLVAVADTSKQARSYAEARHVPKVYDEYQKLLKDSAVDCVIISLPTFLHSECAIAAAEHGKHVLVEKPLARSLKEGKEIATKSRKSGVKMMVGHPLRFSKLAQVKSMLDSSQLGDVVTAIATDVWHGPFSPVSSTSSPQPVAPWWFDPESAGGGALIDLGSHMIDLLHWFFGNKLTSVKSLLGYRFNLPVEDHAMCLMKFESGPSATVNVGWYSQKKSIEVDLFGTTGSTSVSLIDERKSARIMHLLGIKQLSEAAAFHNELNHFVNCVLNDAEPSPSVVDGLKVIETITMAYENQIRLNQTIEED